MQKLIIEISFFTKRGLYMIVPLKKKISQTRHLVNSESYLIHRVKY